MSERILQTEREVTYWNELAEDEVLWRYFIRTVINVGYSRKYGIS